MFQTNVRISAIRKTGAAVAWLICSALAQAQTPVVVGTAINYTTKQITIAGTNLLPSSGSPVVHLDGASLTLVSSTSTQIVADLPAGLAAGSFRLTVSHGTSTTGVFDMTYGAVGPQGATGPAGPSGPQGPAGPPARLARKARRVPPGRLVHKGRREQLRCRLTEPGRARVPRSSTSPTRYRTTPR